MFSKKRWNIYNFSKDIVWIFSSATVISLEVGKIGNFENSKSRIEVSLKETVFWDNRQRSFHKKKKHQLVVDITIPVLYDWEFKEANDFGTFSLKLKELLDSIVGWECYDPQKMAWPSKLSQQIHFKKPPPTSLLTLNVCKLRKETKKALNLDFFNRITWESFTNEFSGPRLKKFY